jgi:DNA mismatch endonuclease (patch repair protein)
MGYRFRLRQRGILGKPDVVLPRWRVVVFVHGCFWHRHPGCPNTRTPKSKIEFWTRKFDENVRRDEEVLSQLSEAGWRILVIWECELKDIGGLRERVESFMGGLAACDRSNSSVGRED